MYNPSEAIELRKNVTAGIQLAFQETMKTPILVQVNSSSITHTALQPVGDMFTITFQVMVYPRKEKPDAPDVHIEP